MNDAIEFERALASDSAVFNRGKRDAFLGNPRLTHMDEVWKESYENGFQEGARLRHAAQEVDAYRQELADRSLRMRPTRFILGEVRNEECAEFIQAINTGHQAEIVDKK